MEMMFQNELKLKVVSMIKLEINLIMIRYHLVGLIFRIRGMMLMKDQWIERKKDER
jgi:hypothetical protein